VSEPTFDGHQVLMRLRGLPGGRELLELASGRDDVELVGGAVRDLMLGRVPRELDVVVGGGEASLSPALPFARELAARLDALAETSEHERFGTALVTWDGAQVDVASARRERYAVPGALPEVEPATLEEDLLRRDFTVNALAVTLDSTRPGEVHAPPGALEDLRAGRLRVLHNASFRDDPTRLLRLARYAARLGFEVEAETLRLAREAIGGGALKTVSRDRVAAELALAAAERDPVGAFVALDDLGALGALDLPSPFDRSLADAALSLLPQDGSRAVLTLAVAFHPAEPAPAALEDVRVRIEELTVNGETCARVREAALGSFALAPPLANDPSCPPSRLRALLGGVRPEAVALTAAMATRASPEAQEAASRWLSELRHVTLEIDGGDLLGAGVPEGPEIGQRLQRALARKLDGELDGEGRDAELAAALEGGV
jgi:tRNA nucleotidyltransferase (CCA-adding enzyme)